MEDASKKIRHDEIDIAKAVCIVGMVIVHCFESFYVGELVPGTFAEALLNKIQMLVGAPCFMFCMGASIVFSRHNEPEQTMKRGLKLFFLAYVLNIFRSGLLYFVLALSKSISFNSTSLIYELLNVDIMHFAGLALMLIGFLRKIKFDEIKIIIVGIVLSIIGSLFRFIPLNDISSYLVGLFVGTLNTNLNKGVFPTYFPLFNWFIFVAFGYLFGSILNKIDNKKKFYGILIPIFSVIVTIYLIYAISKNKGMLNGDFKYYYQLLTYETLISISACIVYLGIYYFLSLIFPKFFIKLCNSFSRNINRIYCIHWVIIGNITVYVIYVNPMSFSSTACFIVAAVTVVISYMIALWYEKMKKVNV